jgi:DNA-binding transcriptional MerR regulator
VADDGLSPGAVSRRLGIAVTTLRTWHQRYGLGPSGHEAGSHRRYAEADLARLETMRQLTSQGVPAAEAARIARRSGSSAAAPRPRRAGGGHTIGVGRAGAAARGLGSAATRLDMPAMRHFIESALASDGVLQTWNGLLRPVLAGVGRRHAASGKLVEVEHLLSRCISEALSAVPRPAADVPIWTMLACADEEQHSLPIEALAAALAERGIACRQLGARVPPEALLAAARRTGPRAVLLWSHAAATAHPQQLQRVIDLSPPPAIVAAAGPGWGDHLPPGTRSPATLDEAIELIIAVG